MGPQAFLNKYRPTAIYHFTDAENIESVRKYGLLSFMQLSKKGIRIPRPGGNELSRMLDKSKDLEDFVHLCFRTDHPMAYVAQKEGRIKTLKYLNIKPEVLTWPGVMGCSTVANGSEAKIVPIGTVLDNINFEVLYSKYPDFSDRQFKQGNKAEILVPKEINLEYIVNL